VTWVIQTDGLMLQNKTDPLPAHEEKHCVQVSVADIKHLGESSIISLRTDLVPEVHFRMTLTGPQRLDIEDKATMNLLLDTSWIHIMPMT
jgi:hypothetical protein